MLPGQGVPPAPTAPAGTRILPQADCGRVTGRLVLPMMKLGLLMATVVLKQGVPIQVKPPGNPYT